MLSCCASWHVQVGATFNLLSLYLCWRFPRRSAAAQVSSKVCWAVQCAQRAGRGGHRQAVPANVRYLQPLPQEAAGAMQHLRNVLSALCHFLLLDRCSTCAGALGC